MTANLGGGFFVWQLIWVVASCLATHTLYFGARRVASLGSFLEESFLAVKLFANSMLARVAILLGFSIGLSQVNPHANVFGWPVFGMPRFTMTPVTFAGDTLVRRRWTHQGAWVAAPLDRHAYRLLCPSTGMTLSPPASITLSESIASIFHCVDSRSIPLNPVTVPSHCDPLAVLEPPASGPLRFVHLAPLNPPPGDLFAPSTTTFTCRS